MSEAKPVAPVPAATILIVRDSTDGLEVFMVKRHHQIDFVAGALVFPGGKVHGGDREAALCEHMDGAEHWSPKCGQWAPPPFGKHSRNPAFCSRGKWGGEFVSRVRLAALENYRERLEKGEISLLDMVRGSSCGLPAINWFPLPIG